MLKTRYRHVTVDENGIAFVGHPRVPVAQIALEVEKLGFSPQELQLFTQRHLSLGQIYSALSFYRDSYFDQHPTVLDRIEALRRTATANQVESDVRKWAN